jgi:ferredoxin
MSYFRVNDNCNGCLACVQNCPASALRAESRGDTLTLQHNMTRCARCGQCWRVCPQQAIEFEHLLEGAWDDVVTLEAVRCAVCGVVLYAADFHRTLAERLQQEIEPLCPRHQEEFDRLKRAYSLPGEKRKQR